MKIQIEDTVYEGTAAGIMEQLRDLSFDPTEFPDVETYIWFVQNKAALPNGRAAFTCLCVYKPWRLLVLPECQAEGTAAPL